LPNSLARGFHTAVDVGTTKICVVVSRTSSRGIDIVGHGLAARSGVTDLDATARAIRDAVSQAERRAQLRISAVYASIAQAQGQAFGVGAETARSIADREALVLCLERAGLSVIDVVPSSLASAESALDAAARENGVALLDIGASTTDLVIYERATIVKTEVIEFGGATLTSEVATRFGVSIAEAEFLKRNVGIAATEFLDGDELVAVPNCSHGEGTAIRRRELARAIEARLETLWRRARSTLGSRDLPEGVVVSGGATLLFGFPALAELRLGRPVRRAAPFGLVGLPGRLHSPSFATGVGLALYVARNASELRQRSPSWGRRRLASA
jgi:cell division ATPase FtsA